jgi:hypothetical protein
VFENILVATDGSDLAATAVEQAGFRCSDKRFGGGGSFHFSPLPRRLFERDQAVTGRAALDWLNFFLADVQAGVGPFLAILLISSGHWDPGKIGVAIMIAGVATVAAHAPFGALIDWTRWKRALVVIAAVAVALGAVAMSLFPNFWLVAAG